MKVITAIFLAGFSCLSMANEQLADGSQAEQGKVVKYSYGMDLDIAKVVKSADLQGFCGIQPVQMTYRDTAGEHHTVEYLTHGSACGNG
jgi:hypothetical protein